MKVGILGGYGNFGSSLSNHIEDRCEIEVSRSKKIEDNAKIVAESDLIFIAVPPQNVLTVLAENEEGLVDKSVVSFAAAITVEVMESATKLKVSRAMGYGDFGTIVCTELLDPKVKNFMSQLAVDRLQIVEDLEVDEFTAQLAYLQVVISFSEVYVHEFKKRAPWLQPHLDFLATQDFFDETGIQVTCERKRAHIFDFTESIAEQSTKGGVSEAILCHLKRDPEATPAMLLLVAQKQLKAMSEV